jgi:hypothetical protein
MEQIFIPARLLRQTPPCLDLSYLDRGRPPEWRKARDSGLESRLCRSRPGDPWGGTIGPASPGLGEGLAGRDVLVPSRTSDSCGGLGTVYVDTVTRCTVFPLKHIGAAGFRVKWALCQEAVRLGWVSADAWLSTFGSPVSVWELQR